MQDGAQRNERGDGGKETSTLWTAKSSRIQPITSPAIDPQNPKIAQERREA